MAGSSFLWGAATSAHQVEGQNIHNDWWAWEQRLPVAQRSGAACDHWNRWPEDLALAKQLGHTAHRFSIEWSRIEPQPGKFNRSVIEHYKAVLEEMKRLHLTPFVTLHHFTNPAWLTARGGWTHPETPELFARYVTYVAQHLGELIDFWVTINEPLVYVTQGYTKGIWPPHEKSTSLGLKVLGNMAKGHRAAYRAIHRISSKAQVGVAHSVVAYKATAEADVLEKMVVAGYNRWYNHVFLDLTTRTNDFLGLNYYFSITKRVSLQPPFVRDEEWKGHVSDMKWSIDPEGLTAVLKQMHMYRLPIYVTENGIADAEDARRAEFIRSHLRAIEVAQADGLDVRGYFHWSLLDNFEWDKGFTPRFGLVEVDFATQKRVPRPSAYVYKAIIEQAQRRVD